MAIAQIDSWKHATNMVRKLLSGFPLSRVSDLWCDFFDFRRPARVATRCSSSDTPCGLFIVGLCGHWLRAWARLLVWILGADFGADFGCGFWRGFLDGLWCGLFNWLCGFWVQIFSGFFQKAPNRRTQPSSRARHGCRIGLLIGSCPSQLYDVLYKKDSVSPAIQTSRTAKIL